MPNPSYTSDTSNTNEQPDGCPAMLARTGISDIFGKLDDDLPTIRINGDVLDLMRRNARAAGISFSEYLRNKIYVAEYGYEHIKSMREANFLRSLGNAPINAPHIPGEGPEA